MLNSLKTRASLFISIAALLVSACGGGGGSSTASIPSAPSVPTPTLVTGVPPATYAANSYSAAIFTQVNAIRANVGSGLLTQNAQLDAPRRLT